jgi:cell division protein FtsB
MGMKIGRVLLLFVLAMGMAIAFGDRGLRDNLAMRERLMALHKSNQDIVRENASLSQTVRLLTDDMGYIERVARNELGMVKKGDIVYRLEP